MSDGAFFLFLALRYLFPLVALCFAVAAGWLAWRRNKARAKKFGLYAFAILMTGMLGQPVLQWQQTREWAESITGVAFSPKTVFKYDSPRDFNGDGYSFYVFEVPASKLSSLTNLTELRVRQLPSKGSHRDDWQRVEWFQGPLNGDPDDVLSLTFWPEAEPGSQLREMQDKARTALSKSTTLIAYLFKSTKFKDSERPVTLNVDMFILLPEERKLIVINCNT